MALWKMLGLIPVLIEYDSAGPNRAGAFCCLVTSGLLILAVIGMVLLYIFKGRDPGKTYTREYMRAGLSPDEMEDKWKPPR